jgi:hypothetical protein
MDSNVGQAAVGKRRHHGQGSQASDVLQRASDVLLRQTLKIRAMDPAGLELGV